MLLFLKITKQTVGFYGPTIVSVDRVFFLTLKLILLGKPTKLLTYNTKIWLISKINNFIHVFSAFFELLWSLITCKKSNLKVMFGVTPTQIDWLLIKWRHHTQNSNFSLSKHVVWYHFFRLSLLSPFLCRKRFR